MINNFHVAVLASILSAATAISSLTAQRHGTSTSKTTPTSIIQFVGVEKNTFPDSYLPITEHGTLDIMCATSAAK
jgi:hypothetical protein